MPSAADAIAMTVEEAVEILEADELIAYADVLLEEGRAAELHAMVELLARASQRAIAEMREASTMAAAHLASAERAARRESFIDRRLREIRAIAGSGA